MFFLIYISLWVSACLIAVILYIKDRKSYILSHSHYWRFLFKRWKVITFLIAAAGMTVVAPYTDDPTWDYFDAMFMSLLTFLTAPWVVGTIYKAIKKELPLKQIYVAVCIWMFSASWSYDLYLLFRDGYYPATWLANISASSVLYISAGFFWNLDWKREKGVFFSFRENDWPMPSYRAIFPKIFWFALPFIALITLVILIFLYVYIN